MIDQDQLVQRFLDQELSAEERLRFVARLGRDEMLRHRVIELEALLLEVDRLPRPAVPEGFAARVMERTAAVRPIWIRLIDQLWVPRSLQWNLASAVVAAVAVVAVVVTGGLVARRSLQSGSSALDTRSRVFVRLVILQPGATSVEAAGDFNGWNPARTPLEQISNGAWAVTLPLEPGRYNYMYVVNGREWIVDPFASEQSDDGFGSQNAVLDVRAPGSPL